jgi:hypothetical protein
MCREWNPSRVELVLFLGIIVLMELASRRLAVLRLLAIGLLSLLGRRAAEYFVQRLNFVVHEPYSASSAPKIICDTQTLVPQAPFLLLPSPRLTSVS